MITKKLYNQTSWRRPHNQYFAGYGGSSDGYYPNPEDIAPEYRSVEDMAMIWLKSVDASGVGADGLTDGAATSYDVDRDLDFKKKIVDFGAAHNRRICYIIELNKNPATWGPACGSAMGNPLNSSGGMIPTVGGGGNQGGLNV